MAVTLVFSAFGAAGWERIGFLPTDYDYVIYPAATASILGLVVGSLLTAPPRAEQVAPFLSETRASAA